MVQGIPEERVWTTPRLDLGQTDGQGVAPAGYKALPGWTVGVRVTLIPQATLSLLWVWD